MKDETAKRYFYFRTSWCWQIRSIAMGLGVLLGYWYHPIFWKRHMRYMGICRYNIYWSIQYILILWLVERLQTPTRSPIYRSRLLSIIIIPQPRWHQSWFGDSWCRYQSFREMQPSMHHYPLPVCRQERGRRRSKNEALFILNTPSPSKPFGHRHGSWEWMPCPKPNGPVTD